MRRVDLQRIAAGKLEDAELLLANRRYANAYYLAGYAVEIALKACAARQITTEVIPDRTFLQNVFTHNLDQLVQLAGLKSELRDRQRKSPRFLENWAIVSEWRPDSRYESIDPYTASTLVAAVGELEDGVLQWIRAYW